MAGCIVDAVMPMALTSRVSQFSLAKTSSDLPSTSSGESAMTLCGAKMRSPKAKMAIHAQYVVDLWFILPSMIAREGMALEKYSTNQAPLST